MIGGSPPAPIPYWDGGPPPVGWENPTGRESRKRWESSLPGRLVKVKKAEILKIPCSQSIDSRSRTKNLQTAGGKRIAELGELTLLPIRDQ